VKTEREKEMELLRDLNEILGIYKKFQADDELWETIMNERGVE